MRKKCLKIIAATLILGTLPMHAVAAQPPAEIQVFAERPTPYWTNFDEVTPALEISGGTISAGLFAQAYDDNAKITGTMYLQKYSSGKWVNVRSWSVSGTSYLSVRKDYAGGIEGVSYRTKAVVKIGTEKVEMASDASTY